MTAENPPLPKPLRTEITSEYDVGTLWKSVAFPRGDRTSLHLHCLDLETKETPDVQGSSPCDSPVQGAEDGAIQRLSRDLGSLSAFTDGILLSWGGKCGGGPKSSTIITDAISPLFRNGALTIPDFQTGRSVCVAVPKAAKAEQGGEDVPTPPAHHLLLPSHAHSSTRVLKHLMNTSVSDGKAVLCVVVGGGMRMMKMACYALEHHIPVIVAEGTGGLADTLCNFYSQSEVYRKKNMREEWNGKLRKEDLDRLFRVYEQVKTITFYKPADPSSKNLDAVILDAFLKHGQFDHAERYLEIVQRRLQDRKQTFQQHFPCFIGSSAKRVNLFLKSLQEHSPSACAVLVRHLHISYKNIDFKRLLELYEKSQPRRRGPRKKRVRIIGNSIVSFFCLNHAHDSDDEGQDEGHTSKTDDLATARYKKTRQDVRGYTEGLMATPLKCLGPKNCKRCQEALQGDNSPSRPTCLPPVQELFIWSLFFGNTDLTEALLERIPGKMAAALFAFAIFTGMAKKEREREQTHTLMQQARHFEDLATRCLRSCYEDDASSTEDLLIGKCANWDEFSPLQIAIVAKSKAFVAEDGAKHRLDRIWNGSKIGESGFTDESELTCRDDLLRVFTPVFAFSLAFVFQLLFLLLFSYVLLFDLHDSPTPGFLVLAIYVIDLAADEILQLLVDNPVLRAGCTCNLKQKLRAHVSEKWNHLDLLAIILFGLGLLVFVDNEVAHAFGRVFLCLDALVFFLRFLQMLLYFKNLGIFLVMAKRSMKDTGYFMLILLTVMWGYLVASHGVLFPPPNNTTSTWSYVLDLPLKGYWQAFNLDLSDVSVCQEVTHRKLEDGECKKESILATHYGHYVASVLLALYLMFINVLLMNLLIAKFNNTFTEVYQKAELHQSWQYCQLVLEYYTHTPAPFSIFSLVFTTLLSCCGVCLVCCLQLCPKSCRRRYHRRCCSAWQDSDDDDDDIDDHAVVKIEVLEDDDDEEKEEEEKEEEEEEVVEEDDVLLVKENEEKEEEEEEEGVEEGVGNGFLNVGDDEEEKEEKEKEEKKEEEKEKKEEEEEKDVEVKDGFWDTNEDEDADDEDDEGGQQTVPGSGFTETNGPKQEISENRPHATAHAQETGTGTGTETGTPTNSGMMGNETPKTDSSEEHKEEEKEKDKKKEEKEKEEKKGEKGDEKEEEEEKEKDEEKEEEERKDELMMGDPRTRPSQEEENTKEKNSDNKNGNNNNNSDNNNDNDDDHDALSLFYSDSASELYTDSGSGDEKNDKKDDDDDDDDNADDDDDDDDDDDYYYWYEGYSVRNDPFENVHMQKVLRSVEAERGDKGRAVTGGVTLAALQGQLDQLRYGLQQVLRKLEAQPLPGPSSSSYQATLRS